MEVVGVQSRAKLETLAPDENISCCEFPSWRFPRKPHGEIPEAPSRCTCNSFKAFPIVLPLVPMFLDEVLRFE